MRKDQAAAGGDNRGVAWKRWLLPASVLPLLLLLAYGLTRSPDEIPSQLVGKEAPAFSLETLEGDTLSLDDLTGSTPLILNFWATWCVPCVQEHRIFLDVERIHPDEELRIAGVLYQDRPRNARRWVQERGGGWPVLLDPGSQTALDYGIAGVPETFFITRDGVVAHKHAGPVTASLLQTWIPRLLEGASPAAGDRGTSAARVGTGSEAPGWSGDGGAAGP